MPPSAKLQDAEIEALERWVAEGAHWPDEAARTEGPRAEDYWAFQPVAKPVPPAVGNAAWPRSSIDRFILAKLEEKHLTPAGDADKYTLLRRATLNLTGLLPTPEQIQAFVNDISPGVFQNAVDCLLDSPAYGERWGRHWLDVTYYADTTGVGRRIPLKQAWRYRDYVVNSFNADKPYSRFVYEQIAGPGAGVKEGTIFGETDEYAWRGVDGRVHVHDLQATILHLLGLDHEKLTYRYSGRDFRLTDVHGQVVKEVLS